MGLMSSATRQRCRSVAVGCADKVRKRPFYLLAQCCRRWRRWRNILTPPSPTCVFVKPLDEALIFRLADEHDYLITAEENVIAGGGGSAVSELLDAQNIHKPILHLGFTGSLCGTWHARRTVGRMRLKRRGDYRRRCRLAGRREQKSRRCQPPYRFIENHRVGFFPIILLCVGALFMLECFALGI